MSFREAIEQWGAHLRFLPRSSPDFNPVELAFAKLKPLLRKAAARTTEDLWTAIAATHDAFIPPECSNDLPTHDTSQKDRKNGLGERLGRHHR